MRLLLLLSLNCGFGRAELASLQKDTEVSLGQPHGHYPDLTGSWVKRLRGKSEVYGEWQLWPETVAGLRWYLARRPVTTETALLVSTKGKAMSSRTPSGKDAGLIAKEWRATLRKAEKVSPGFRRLAFKMLRKTAGNLIKRASDGETAGVFLCHGRTVRTDILADVYTDRNFLRVFEALAKVRERLAPVFSVGDPFPEGKRLAKSALPQGERERILALRKAGKSYVEIGRQVGVAPRTVNRYLRMAGLVKKYKR
jgi:hypothetical protein